MVNQNIFPFAKKTGFVGSYLKLLMQKPRKSTVVKRMHPKKVQTHGYIVWLVIGTGQQALESYLAFKVCNKILSYCQNLL